MVTEIIFTWCPNCRDETKFLVDYLAQQPASDLVVIGLAFERHKEKAKAIGSIRTYRSYFDIPYEILYAGPSDKAEASRRLPSAL